ncbi:LuxR C-terminal-related transcriptional regulator [Rhodococcus sp. O3]|uniref:helix-turn-helix transcriptional regulator n=1 Tax=Rhodococcus sp. O3 TaxID=3404919 RepID=UPI003B671FBD
MGIVEDLARAREAFERREWAVAFDRLSCAGALDAGDLTDLATAAFLSGEVDAAVRALQRGYAAEVRQCNPLGAVRFACWLCLVLSLRGEMAVAGGWVARAQRLLGDRTDDVATGFLSLFEMHRHLAGGDLAGAEVAANRMSDAGYRSGNADLIALGLMDRGRLLMYSGHVAEGLDLLDESMVGVAASEVSPIVAGMIYCSMIEGCQEVADFVRAESWTSALTRWCEAQPSLVPFTGQCAVHRGQILRLHGEFTEAIDEFAHAAQRYAETGTPGAAGLALAEQGDVLRIRGEYDEAEAAFTEASVLGYEPQPGLTLLWSCRGRTSQAVAAVRRLLAETPDPVRRSRVLPAAVEVLTGGHRIDEARSAARELTELSTGFGCIGLRAMAAYACGIVELASGETESALRSARDACRIWTDLDAPYEVARSRVLIGTAIREIGDEYSARTELTAARGIFDRLGAVPDERDVDRMLRHGLPGGLTEREVEVLRLVATGCSNPEIAERLVLSEKTVARHLSNIFTKLDVTSRTAAAAYAHEHGLL